MKIFIFFLFAAAVVTQMAEAKPAPYDSAHVINKAQHDASRFRLKSSELKKFIIENWPVSSDYFKPAAKSIPGHLINDSLYITTYRTTAYYNAVNERPILERREPLLVPANANPATPPGNHTDIAHLARLDVKKFNLSTDMLKRFKATPFPITSDYFNPTTKTTADTGLLNDSTYVKDFRQQAFYKSVNGRVHPVGHVLGIVGMGAVALSIFTVLMVAYGRQSHG